jgi:hypothetical protein
LKQLEHRDEFVQRQLDAATPASGLQLDAQGRVLVDRAAARLLLQNESNDRWETAKELSSYYAR